MDVNMREKDAVPNAILLVELVKGLGRLLEFVVLDKTA
jgi:hypothetical protein